MASRRKASTLGKEIDLDAMVASGPQGAYEALQLYRSRAIRYKTKNDTVNAIATLNQGAKALFLNSYKNAGSELANLLIDFLTEFNSTATTTQIDMLLELNSLFELKGTVDQAATSNNEKEEFNHNHFSNRLEFLKNSVKWSVKCGQYELGEPRIHVALGQCLWQTACPQLPTSSSATSAAVSTGAMETYNKNLQFYHVNRSSAIYHLVCGESPYHLNQIIQSIEITTFNDTNDAQIAQKGIITKDRALTLGVLTFLSLDNLKDANELLNYYRMSLAAIMENNTTPNEKRSASPPNKKKGGNGSNSTGNSDDFQFAIESPLETFCRYLLLTCQRDAQALFKTLVNTYAKVLDFDENVPALLTGPIGLKFFGIQQKVQVNPMMNMLQQMLSK